MSKGLNLDDLRNKNVQRCKECFPMCDDWKYSDWSNAMVGESGEFIEELLKFAAKCNGISNLTKKIVRGDVVPPEELENEMADVIIYADLLSNALKINLSDAIRRKFNKVSDKKGSSIKLLEE